MTRLGIPVPPGFTVTTEACNAYLAHDRQFPPGQWEQETAALRRLEEKTGKRLGDPSRPLFVSCRSGAKFSMPGMMDTVLNIGLNDETAKGLIALTGDPRFVYDSYRRLVQMFGAVVLGVPGEPFEDFIEKIKKNRGVRLDVELDAEDWQRITAHFKGQIKSYTGRQFPQDPLRTTGNGHPGRLQQLVRQAGRGLPQRHRNPPRPGHRRQYSDGGLRQPGRPAAGPA